MAESVVRVQALDGAWETVGVDRLAGVWPENLELSSDQWGSKGCTFDLRRDPTASWPDLLAFTPIEVDIDGQLSWSGRVSETPSRDGTDRVMSVVGEGWQHHLDDDLVDRKWVVTALGGWRDLRGVPDALLGVSAGKLPVAPQVDVGNGTIRIAWPAGTAVVQNTYASVVLDLGPANLAKRIVVTADAGGFDQDTRLYVRGCASPSDPINGSPQTDAGILALGGLSTSTTFSGNLSSGYRYVYLIVFRNGVTTTQAAVDSWCRIKDVQVFAETAYESGNASVLKASTVVSDVLDRGTPLLSTDRSGITATSFSLPEYAPDGPRTPREHIGAVNAFHGWMAKVDPDRRMVFQALPSRPKFTLGDWSAFELQDAAGSSGADIYNRVLVTGQDPAGQAVQVSRTAVQAFGLPTIPQTDIVVSNPSFETNTAGWSSGDPLTRTTTAGEFDSAPAGLEVRCSRRGRSDDHSLRNGAPRLHIHPRAADAGIRKHAAQRCSYERLDLQRCQRLRLSHAHNELADSHRELDPADQCGFPSDSDLAGVSGR